MLETRAVVIQVEGREAVVEASHGGGCGQCSGDKGCGSGKLSQLFCSSQPRRFRVLNSISARPGDEVVITVADGAVLRGATVLYLLPLATLLAGGGAGSFLAPDAASRDVYGALGALLGIVAGFGCARFLARRQAGAGQGQPCIARRWQGD